MKRYIALLTIPILVVATVILSTRTLSPARAAPPETQNTVVAQGEIASATWTSGVSIQNLGTGTANIQVRFYDTNGTQVSCFGCANEPQAQIEGGKSKLVPFSSMSAGFFGSAVVSSDQPVAAIVNLAGNGPTNGIFTNPIVNDSYRGFTDGSASVRTPLIMRNAFGGNWHTLLYVQNTTSSPVAVNIQFQGGPTGTETGVVSGATKNDTIPAYTVKVYDQSKDSTLGSVFVGSATISTSTAGGKVAAVVNQINTGDTQYGVSQVYTAFGSSDGASTLYAPVLFNSVFPDYITAIAVQNAGTANTDVTVTFTDVNPGSGSGTNSTSVTRTNIPPGGLANFYQGGGGSSFWAGENHRKGWIGSAAITSSNGQPLVAAVNMSSIDLGRASTYSAGTAASATSKLVSPVIFSNAYGNAGGGDGWNTAVTIQNVGNVATDVTATYSGTGAGKTLQYSALNSGQLLQPGKSWGIYDGPGGPAAHADGFAGAGTFTATAAGAKIVATIQQEEYPSSSIVGPGNTTGGDYQQTFNGINVTP